MRELLADDPDRPVVAWHDLAHVIGILSRLAALGLAPGEDQPAPVTKPGAGPAGE
jgi:hypothetical protein